MSKNDPIDVMKSLCLSTNRKECYQSITYFEKLIKGSSGALASCKHDGRKPESARSHADKVLSDMIEWIEYVRENGLPEEI